MFLKRSGKETFMAKSDINDDSLVMTVTEAGRLLGKGKGKSYELAHKGVFPVIYLEGRMLVPKQRFLNWVNGWMNGIVESETDQSKK